MNIIDELKSQALIYEKDGKYYSCCAKNEEITIEIKELVKAFEG